MSRNMKLLAVLMALCLVFPLAGSAAADPPGMPPALVGSWIGYHKDLCGQFTFFPDERYEMTVFEDPSLDRFGSCSALPKAEAIAFEGEYWYLTIDGEKSTFRKTDSPYIRVKAGKETTAASVDPILVGTFGGKRNNVYIEWTFRGDGSFSQVTPYEQMEENGYFIAAGGEMAILLSGKITACSYRKSGNALILTLPDAENVFFRQKNGKLEQMSFDESFGFGWMHTKGTGEPRGYIAARYAGSETVVGIPGTVAMIAVVGIGDEAFKDNRSLTSVTLPPWIRRIGDASFAGCKSLTEVLLIKTGEDEPDASEDSLLDAIGDNAFRGCTSLTRLNVAADASPSPHSRFGWIGGSDLPGVNIPSGVTTIGAHAFDGCSSIESLKLPAGVRSIGEGAFSNCPHLTLRVLDGSYAQLYAQRNAIPFETIDSVEAMFEWDFTQDEDPSGVIITRYPGNKAEVGIPAAIALTQVTRIGDEAFKGNKNLISVTISDFVTSIGKGAFEGCDNLKRVYLIGTDTDNGGKYLADYAIAGVTVLPGSCPLKTIGEDAFRGCTSLQDMDLALTVSPSSYPPHWWIG